MCPLCRPALGRATYRTLVSLLASLFLCYLSRFVRSLTLIRPQTAGNVKHNTQLRLNPLFST